MTTLTPVLLQEWLEWAGARLIAMPGRRIAPAEPTVIWPEYNRNAFEVLDFRRGLALRAVAPNKDEIDIVDEILLFPNVCTDVIVRRVLHTRALVHPLNGRHLFPWTRIAKLLSTDHKHVQRWHARGLTEVVAKLETARVCRVSAFLSTPR